MSSLVIHKYSAFSFIKEGWKGNVNLFLFAWHVPIFIKYLGIVLTYIVTKVKTANVAATAKTSVVYEHKLMGQCSSGVS